METSETTFPGSVLVFSTFATELTEDEKVVIRTLIIKQRTLAEQKKPHNRILILTGHELRCYWSPPQSWSDEVKARAPTINYNSLYDLKSLCPATQKLHIGF